MSTPARVFLAGVFALDENLVKSLFQINAEKLPHLFSGIHIFIEP